MGQFEEEILNLSHSLDYNQRQCLLKAELKTKNSTKRSAVVWLSIWCSTQFTRKKVTRLKLLTVKCIT